MAGDGRDLLLQDENIDGENGGGDTVSVSQRLRSKAKPPE
jgi:hypothetical protein